MTLLDWLPITKKETDLRGWDEVDIVFVTGDTLKPIHIQLTEKGTECGMNRYETALKKPQIELLFNVFLNMFVTHP